MAIETDEQRRQRFLETLARAEEMLRQRKRLLRHASQERQTLRQNAGKPCGAPTKKGGPCARLGYANGLCGSHGGKDAMTLWLERQPRERPTFKRKWALPGGRKRPVRRRAVSRGV